MHRVVMLEQSRKQIDSFISSYLHTSISLFVDSGIENIEFIKANYENTAKKFRDEIYQKIMTTFEANFLAKRVSDAGELSVIIPVWNFRLFVDYTENKEEKVRYIENIEFYKK